MCDKRKVYYNTVLSQTFSDCGEYIFVGNTYGDIFIINCKKESNEDTDDYSTNLPNPFNFEVIKIFNFDENLPVYSLAFHRGFLIVGTEGFVSGYIWDSKKLDLTKKAWTVNIPARPELVETTDVNTLWVNTTLEKLYVGCGDNAIYEIDLEDGKICRKFTGHKDYIHCVTGDENHIYSAGEDGQVLLWDRRTSNETGKIQPYQNQNIVRPEFGKWLGTVSITNDWLICGGGPKSSMWHLRSMECLNILNFPEKVHCSGLIDDLIYIAGEHKNLQEYSFNGDEIAQIPISGASAYSVVWQNKPFEVMCIGGASNSLDICTNFNYKDMTLNLYNYL